MYHAIFNTNRTNIAKAKSVMLKSYINTKVSTNENCSPIVSETKMGGTNKYVTAHVQVYRISIIIIIVVGVVVVIAVSIPVFRIV